MISTAIFRRLAGRRFLMPAIVAVMSIWSNGQPSASQNLPETVAGFTPKGWQIADRVKEFTPQNLYEQINGRASFFLAYDMVKMTYVSYENSNDFAKFINVSIYDMGKPTNAFGVFSGERSQGEPPLDLGRAGYRSEANYFIWKGHYYIRIISSGATDEFQRIGLELAQKVTDALPDTGGKVWGLTALPLTDRMPESVQYFKVDAMGLDFMRNTYTADYRKGNILVTAFLSKQASEGSARATVAKYAKYAAKYGKEIDRLKTGDLELLLCDLGGSYDVVFHKGRLVGGVSSAEDRDLAIRAAAEIWQQLAFE